MNEVMELGIKRRCDEMRKHFIHSAFVIERGVSLWKYQSLGLELSMRHQRVWIIRILRNGNRHFDRTGFNCANAPYEFQEAYSFNRVPAAGTFGAFGVGHGEYMWFDNYPQSITLSTFWN